MMTYATEAEAEQAGNDNAHLVDQTGTAQLSDEIAQCDVCREYGYRSDFPGEGGVVADGSGLTCDDCADDAREKARAEAEAAQPCACGCGERTARTVQMLREQDRGTAEALGWAKVSIAPMRVGVYVVDGHEADGIDGYVTEPI